MHSPVRLIAVLLPLALLIGVAATAVEAQGRGNAIDPTPEAVREAIQRGVEFLRSRQRRGNWEDGFPNIGQNRGGATALVMLALLESGVDPNEDFMRKGLNFLRELEPEHTYATSLQTMVFCKAFPKEDRLRIARNVKWLVEKARHMQNNSGIAWGYPTEGRGPIANLDTDNSNTQYAVLALREAQQVGVQIEDRTWKLIQTYYERSQLPNGGWAYHGFGFGLAGGERLTMTAAGVCGLLISGMQLYKNQETLRADGSVQNCGNLRQNDPLSRGLRRLGASFKIRMNDPAMNYYFYNLYGLERAGRLSGLRFFLDKDEENIDWYRMGAADLLRNQQGNGKWSGPNIDGQDVVATSFALLFLAKGKTPVLIFKLTHGQNRGLLGDWNNDRNDVRNLTDYCSQELFKKDGRSIPLTWQIFDASRVPAGDPASLQDLLQAPILFFNGHKAPRFSDGEKLLLKEYVEQGGFIVAEACCGRKEFDEGFRELMKEVFPDWPLEPLPAGHPIWSAAYNVPPGSFKLHGLSRGCKTVLVYAAEDMSCHWESNDYKGQSGGPAADRSALAFRLGANIVAYATGLEPPEDKGTKKEIIRPGDDPTPRNFLQAAQIDYGGRDWQPAPNAMRVVMDTAAKKHGIDVIRQTKPLKIGDPDLFSFKFNYMHGRRAFNLTDDQQKKLREHLENGGLLLADAACGNKEFDRSFREMIQKTFGRELIPIPVTDPFFSDQVSNLFREGPGQPFKRVMNRVEKGKPYVSMDPQLEGVRLDPRNPKSPWIVIYSKYDIGCALDKHASSDCLGYNHESAMNLAIQAVLYALKE